MKKVLFVVLSFWGLNSFAAATGVSPWHCPVEIEYKEDRISEEVEAYLAKGELETAAELARSCANFGSSHDPRILGPVINAYDVALYSILPNHAVWIKDEMIRNCIRRGEDEGGTLGQSVGAHCQIKVLMGFMDGYKK